MIMIKTYSIQIEVEDIKMAINKIYKYERKQITYNRPLNSLNFKPQSAQNEAHRGDTLRSLATKFRENPKKNDRKDLL